MNRHFHFLNFRAASQCFLMLTVETHTHITLVMLELFLRTFWNGKWWGVGVVGIFIEPLPTKIWNLNVWH